MASKPKVFITRQIPTAGLTRICDQCDAEVWPDQLPPPYTVLKDKAAGCDGLVSLLTDRIDAALLDAAPRLKVVSNYAVGFNNFDLKAATDTVRLLQQLRVVSGRGQIQLRPTGTGAVGDMRVIDR